MSNAKSNDAQNAGFLNSLATGADVKLLLSYLTHFLNVFSIISKCSCGPTPSPDRTKRSVGSQS